MTQEYKDQEEHFQSQVLFLIEFFTLNELQFWGIRELREELRACRYTIQTGRLGLLRNQILSDRGLERPKKGGRINVGIKYPAC